jgi:hypothetical protein
MKRWLVVAAAVAVVVPAAYATAPSKEKPTTSGQQSSQNGASQACRAERASLGAKAFGEKYGTNWNLRNAFGKCVSGKSKADKAKGNDDGEKDEKDEKAGDDENEGKAAKQCRSERASLGVDAFEKKYGTNHNLRNAFGKCVSGTSKTKSKKHS